jgi:hypothetical protein
VPYFAREQAGVLEVVVPDLGNDLARRVSVAE